MPLTLVTGPANSAKAGEVLGGYRARLDEEPVLVVPEFRDVEHTQREMASSGAVFGVRVLRFDRLWADMARWVGYSARVATPFQRELLIAEAVRAADLRVLADSARRPGFVRAAASFISELGRAGIQPDGLGEALGTWAPGGPRRAYAAEVSQLYAGYRSALDAAGLVDRELFAWNTLAAFRLEPEGWGSRPVFVYGFDDFTEVQLAGLEALAGRVDVAVSLPFEPGRQAFAALEDQFARLAAAADEHVELEGVSDHYAAASRAALHHLERGLFDAPGERGDPRGAVRAHSAGGERAEVELAAASILDQLAGGVPAGEIAVVFREPESYASLVDQVFGAYGIPFSLERRVRLGNTPLGRGLLALLRCALPELHGSADDLLAYLRMPGRLDVPGLADELEAKVRQDGVREADRAREIWDAANPKLALREIDALRAAAADPDRLLDELAKRVEWLFGRPYLRRAHVFSPDEADAPRTFAAARDAIAQLRALPRRLPASALHDALLDLSVKLGELPQPDRVQVAGPLEVRARRFQVVYLLGLQEGEFPRPAPADPFLSDDDRREIRDASGLPLPVREDQLDRERYLFYVCASRAERLLVLSSRTSDEEGAPQHPSFFLEDVGELLDLPARPDAVRGLSDVVWGLEEAPTRHEWERAAAAAGPRAAPAVPDGLRSDELVRHLAEERALSAGAIEAFADCPVKWLVDRLLRPEALEPDAEALVRGSFAHEVLERVYTELRELPGMPRRVTRENLADAERILLDALRELQAEFPISPDRTRVRTAVRRLEFDLLRYLRREADSTGRFQPEHLELEFGGDDDEPVTAGVEGLRLRGRIDRVDTYAGRALVRDYKSGKGAYPVDTWARDHRLQVAIYMLVLRELRPELELAGGVYDPLAGKSKPRGLLLKDAADDLGGGWTKTDWRDSEGFDAALDEARDAVRDVLDRLRAGDVKPCPASCAWNGGCSYPAICRHEE
jgi:ATP-dependent helicase/DNAse subunit B